MKTSIVLAIAAVWLSGSAAQAELCSEKFFACGNVCEALEDKGARPRCLAACQVEGEKCSVAAAAAERPRRIQQRIIPTDRHGNWRVETPNRP